MRKTLSIIFIGLVVCVVAGSGCKTKDTEGGMLGGETLNPEILEGDFGMDARFEDGVRVPASEFSVDPVYFGYDSYRISSSEKQKIASVASFMKRSRDVKLVVEGHCDERGSREYNMSLGEHRAQAVRAALISDGIASSRIQTRSYGEENPVDARHNDSAWRKNRRGEFALFR